MALDDNPELLPKRSVIGGESVEEHTLADRIAYDKYCKSQEDGQLTPEDGKLGLPIVRRRIRHARP